MFLCQPNGQAMPLYKTHRQTDRHPVMTTKLTDDEYMKLYDAL